MKQWKDIKIGDKLKDGSVVTGIHRTQVEENNIEYVYVVYQGDVQKGVNITADSNRAIMYDFLK